MQSFMECMISSSVAVSFKTILLFGRTFQNRSNSGLKIRCKLSSLDTRVILALLVLFLNNLKFLKKRINSLLSLRILLSQTASLILLQTYERTTNALKFWMMLHFNTNQLYIEQQTHTNNQLFLLVFIQRVSTRGKYKLFTCQLPCFYIVAVGSRR